EQRLQLQVAQYRVLSRVSVHKLRHTLCGKYFRATLFLWQSVQAAAISLRRLCILLAWLERVVIGFWRVTMLFIHLQASLLQYMPEM
ncbi:unnamed protein product, partial [Rotaria socialis]